MNLRGINHIVLKVRDLEASDAFYQGVLGMEKVGERGGMWFYHAGGHPHDLALVETGARAAAGEAQSGLFHFCLDVPDEKALAELYRRCREAGVRVSGGVDHSVMRSFYVTDPDGNVIELGVDVPKENWPADPFATDKPYRIPGS
jgi:catechol 2,3-dioxygenase